MNKQEYAEYLQSEHWDTTRKEAYARANFRCQVCYGKKNLNVHHRTYSNLGHEFPSDLTVLCRDCHEIYHFKMAKLSEPLPPVLQLKRGGQLVESILKYAKKSNKTSKLARKIVNSPHWKDLRGSILTAQDPFVELQKATYKMCQKSPSIDSRLGIIKDRAWKTS